MASEEKNLPETQECKDNAHLTDGGTSCVIQEIPQTSPDPGTMDMSSDYPVIKPVESESSCTSLFADCDNSIEDNDPDRHAPPPLDAVPRKSCLKEKPSVIKCYVSFHLENQVKFFFVENLASMRPVGNKTILNDPTRFEGWQYYPAFSPQGTPLHLTTLPYPDRHGVSDFPEDSESFESRSDKPDIKPANTVAIICETTDDQRHQFQNAKNPRRKKRGFFRNLGLRCTRIKSLLTRCFTCPSEAICLYL